MSIFIYKKKRFKFLVHFHLEELSSVPFVSGILFAKLRLLNGGHFADHTPRQEVEEHCVKWKTSFSFSCKMTSNVNTAVLERCVCRVSVRKELKGGKAYQKLGYADVNLAEYAGAGCLPRRYLLEGYDSKHRQDNSTIMVTVEMSLVSGDPVFKVPTHTAGNMATSGESGSLCELGGEVGKVEESEGSVASGSSGFGSLTRKEKDKQALPVNTPLSESPSSSEERASEMTETFEVGHSRNDSYASQPSAGYGSHDHSRQSSISASNDIIIFSHNRSSSAGSTSSDMFIKLERRRKFEDKERRVDATRVDAVDLVEEIMKETDFGSEDDTLRPGLQLLIGKDGSTALR